VAIIQARERAASSTSSPACSGPSCRKLDSHDGLGRQAFLAPDEP
jgi:hypothetical protein